MDLLAIIYLICVVIFLVTFMVLGKKSARPAWQKILITLFAPFNIAYALCQIGFNAIRHAFASSKKVNERPPSPKENITPPLTITVETPKPASAPTFAPRLKGSDAAFIFAKESSEDYAISLFIEQADKGDHNAMMNLFTVLWANKRDYKKAAEWLIYLENEPDPSLYCLWNLAVLYYMGEELPHNPLPRNHTKAKTLLLHILSEKSHPMYKNKAPLFVNAKRLLLQLK